LKFDKVITLTRSLYRSESWTIKARGKNRIQSVEMRWLRTVNGCTTLGHIKTKIL
jgi:hypothetical protein